MKQMLLFPDPRPLPERLGREFFRSLPETAGVYLMRDAADNVLYVGKARNLRKRLGSYRVANPDRMPRRHLRMLRSVVRIELRECADEAAALAHEAELLRSIRPKFNRAGTWVGTPRFLAWKCQGQELHLAVMEQPAEGWRCLGPAGAGAVLLQGAIARLLWLAVHPQSNAAELPAGWFRRKRSGHVVGCGLELESVAETLEELSAGRADEFVAWIAERCDGHTDPFTTAVEQEDLELATHFLCPEAAVSNLAGAC